MNLAELERKLVTAARHHPPSEAVPYSFSKRIMASLKCAPSLDRMALWAGALWRSACACLIFALLLGGFSLLAPQSKKPDVTGDLSVAFEKTMLAAVDQETDYSR